MTWRDERPADRIIVALDCGGGEAIDLARRLSGRARWVKVGMTLYYAAGPQIVSAMKSLGYRVFVDLKLHDIPHQVRLAAAELARAGADLVTVHALGGPDMMRAAVEGAGSAALSEPGPAAPAAPAALSEPEPAAPPAPAAPVAPAAPPDSAVPPEPAAGSAAPHDPQRPAVIAVTVLTSMDAASLASIGIDVPPASQVEKLATLARESTCDGIVCSPAEASLARRVLGTDALVVTPGVRPAGSELGDQKRVATPAEALAAGASHLVIGRPITAAVDPVAAFDEIAAGL